MMFANVSLYFVSCELQVAGVSSNISHHQAARARHQPALTLHIGRENGWYVTQYIDMQEIFSAVIAKIIEWFYIAKMSEWKVR